MPEKKADKSINLKREKSLIFSWGHWALVAVLLMVGGALLAVLWLSNQSPQSNRTNTIPFLNVNHYKQNASPSEANISNEGQNLKSILNFKNEEINIRLRDMAQRQETVILQLKEMAQLLKDISNKTNRMENEIASLKSKLRKPIIISSKKSSRIIPEENSANIQKHQPPPPHAPLNKFKTKKYSFDQVRWAPGRFKGKKIQWIGRLTSITRDNSGISYSILVDDFKVFQVNFSKIPDIRIRKGDDVTVQGTVIGSKTIPFYDRVILIKGISIQAL